MKYQKDSQLSATRHAPTNTGIHMNSLAARKEEKS